MPTRTLRYAAVYDLSDDRERRRVDKLLSGWGHRIQKSVFSVSTSPTGARRLQQAMEQLQLQSGAVLLLRLQAQVDIVSCGQPFHDPDRDVAYVY